MKIIGQTPGKGRFGTNKLLKVMMVEKTLERYMCSRKGPKFLR